MKFLSIKMVLASLIVGILVICGSHRLKAQEGGNGVYIPPADSWYSPPPESVARKFRDQDQVDRSAIFVVDSAEQAPAIALLDKVPCIPLDAAAVERIRNKVGKQRKGTKPYLVRGLFLNEHTGGYGAMANSNALFVFHMCLGAHPVKMTRQALVVFLKYPPKHVYVGVGMAE